MDVKGNFRLFRPIQLHILLDDQWTSKERPWFSFLRQRESLFSGRPDFSVIACRISSVNLLISFTSPLPSPHLLRISFTISFNLSAYLSDCYPCFEGDEEIFWENKHFRDQRAQRAHRPMGRMGRMGRHFFNTSRTRAQELFFRCKIRVHVRAHRNLRKIAAPSAPSDPSGRWCDTICRVCSAASACACASCRCRTGTARSNSARRLSCCWR